MRLTTERLVLRAFVEEDWERLLAYQATPDYLRFNHWETRTEADVRAFLQRFLDWQQEEPRRKYQFAVVLRASGQLIGTAGVRLEQADAQEGDMGYEIDPAYWRQGYATEAGRAILDFGFGTLGLHRIWAECLAENRASARVLEKLGMTQEGRLREKKWQKGRWWDALLYAILEQEWRAEVGQVANLPHEPHAS